MAEHVPVARGTEQATDFAGHVIMIYGQLLTGSGRTLADRALPTLRLVYRPILSTGDSVRSLDPALVLVRLLPSSERAHMFGATGPRTPYEARRTWRAVLTLARL